MRFEFKPINNFFHNNKLIKMGVPIVVTETKDNKNAIVLPVNTIKALVLERKLIVIKVIKNTKQMSTFNEFIIETKKQERESKSKTLPKVPSVPKVQNVPSVPNIQKEIDNVEKLVKPNTNKRLK